MILWGQVHIPKKDTEIMLFYNEKELFKGAFRTRNILYFPMISFWLIEKG